MIFKSPAKINLFFRILRKRSDGYHEIASLLQAIDLFDTLNFTQTDTDSLTCSDPDLPCDETNLVWKALRVFRSRFPLPFGVKIHLEKKIPCQAGLGGGSGNAATTLWALNELAGGPASLSDLMAMGASLGSDVSFFFSSGTAYCTGRGELVEPRPLNPLQGYLAKPPFGLSTPLVYKETRVEELPATFINSSGVRPAAALPDRSSSSAIAPSAMASSCGPLRFDPALPRSSEPCDEFMKMAELPFAQGLFFNDLEPAAFRLEPRLREFRGKLERMGFESVTMTGSGTAFFCVGKGKDNKGLTPFRSIQRDSGCWYT